jgi:hypothetical protein
MIAKALFDAFVVLEVPRIEVDTIRNMLKAQFPNSKSENIDRTLEIWDSYRTIRDSNSEDSKTGESFLSYRAASQLLQCLEDGIHEDQAVLSCICSKFLTDDDLFKVAKLTINRKFHVATKRCGSKQIQSGTASVTPAGRVPRISRLLALAHHCFRLVQSGANINQSELAHFGQISTIRLT